MRKVGGTILGLTLLVGLTLAAQPAASSEPSGGGVFSSLRRPADCGVSDGAPSVFRTNLPGDTLHVDMEAYNNAIGLTGGGTFYSAARLTPTVACTVETVIFYKWHASADNYLFVWGESTATQPGAVIESVPYSGSDTMTWVSVALPVPVPLDSGEDIWVGPRISHTYPDSFPLGTDDGPRVATRGDWVNNTGVWQELGDLGLSYNWHIRAILGHAPPFANDLGLTEMLAPAAQMEPGSVEPMVILRNFGSAPQADFLVRCLIDSVGTRVYEDSVAWADTLQPGVVDTVTFATWTTGQLGVYDVTMYVSLLDDSNPANDTLMGQALVSMPTMVWVESTAAPSPGRYWCPGTGAYRDTLWFLGGRLSAQTSTRSIVAYDVASGTWIDSGLPTLTTPRRAGGGGLIGNKIYIAGGRDSASTTLNTCHEFDLDTKTFTTKASMPAAAWAVASAVAGDKLFIIGSENGTGTTYEYNPATDSWKTKATLSAARGWASAAGANGLVYVMGGSLSTSVYSDCWCLDPVANTWTQKANMPGPRTYSTAITYKDSLILVIGGCSAASGTPADNKVYVYDIAANKWKTETPKPTNSGWHMLNAIGDAIYVAYGSDCTTPTYLTNLDIGWPPLYGIEVLNLTQPKEACRISPSVVRDFARISYSVAHTGRAELGIYDASGRLIRTLVDGTAEAGNHSVAWNRMDNNDRRVANGTYFYRLTVDGESVSGKAIVLK